MLHGIEANRAELQRLLHRSMKIVEAKALQQAQDLHVFAPSGLDHSCLHQAAQGRELGRQLPLGQRGRLIQGVDLLLDQRQVMDRIEDHVLAVVAARVPCHDLAAAANHDRADIAPDPDIAVATGDRDKVIIGLVAHQCLRTDPSGGLIAGVERRRSRSRM